MSYIRRLTLICIIYTSSVSNQNVFGVEKSESVKVTVVSGNVWLFKSEKWQKIKGSATCQQSSLVKLGAKTIIKISKNDKSVKFIKKGVFTVSRILNNGKGSGFNVSNLFVLSKLIKKKKTFKTPSSVMAIRGDETGTELEVEFAEGTEDVPLIMEDIRYLYKKKDYKGTLKILQDRKSEISEEDKTESVYCKVMSHFNLKEYPDCLKTFREEKSSIDVKTDWALELYVLDSELYLLNNDLKGSIDSLLDARKKYSGHPDEDNFIFLLYLRYNEQGAVESERHAAKLGAELKSKFPDSIYLDMIQ